MSRRGMGHGTRAAQLVALVLLAAAGGAHRSAAASRAASPHPEHGNEPGEAAPSLWAAAPTAPAADTAAEIAAPGAAVPTRFARLSAPAPSRLLPSLRLQALEEAETPAPPSERGGKSRYVLPVLLSAIVPGAGEIATGHLWNGLPLLAVDIATWIGYAHYESEGDRLTEEYRRFADQHWAEDRWQENLMTTHWWDSTAAYNCNCSPPYIPKEEDAVEYYENADTLISVAAITRVVSVAQTIWLVRRGSRREGLMFEPVTFGGFGSGLRVKASF